MNARALPHTPARNRPARRWLALSLLAWVRATRLRPSLSWAMPRVAVRSPLTKRFCSRVGGGGGGGAGTDSARAESAGGGVGCCAPATVVVMQNSTARQRITAPLSRGFEPWL